MFYLLSLGQGVVLLKCLQCLDLLQKLVQQKKGLRSQRLVQNLGIEVSGLDGHLDLLHQHTELLG